MKSNFRKIGSQGIVHIHIGRNGCAYVRNPKNLNSKKINKNQKKNSIIKSYKEKNE